MGLYSQCFEITESGGVTGRCSGISLGMGVYVINFESAGNVFMRHRIQIQQLSLTRLCVVLSLEVKCNSVLLQNEPVLKVIDVTGRWMLKIWLMP